MDRSPIPEIVDGLPNLCGHDAQVEEVTRDRSPVYLSETNLRLDRREAASVAKYLVTLRDEPKGTAHVGNDEVALVPGAGVVKHTVRSDRHHLSASEVAVAIGRCELGANRIRGCGRVHAPVLLGWPDERVAVFG